MEQSLTPGLEHERTTPEFDNDSVPAGLLRDHRVATGVWGRLVVTSGSLRLVFADTQQVAEPGQPAIIPPDTPHHVEFDGPVTFAVEFHRPPR